MLSRRSVGIVLLSLFIALSTACGDRADSAPSPRESTNHSPREPEVTTATLIAVVGDGPLVPGTVLRGGDVLEVPAGTRAQVELADGTRLRINESTALSIPTGDRSVTLTGGEVVAVLAADAPSLRLRAADDELTIEAGEARVWASGDRRAFEVVSGRAVLRSGGRELELGPGVHVETPLSPGEALPSLIPTVRPLAETAWTHVFDEAAAANDELPPGVGSLTGRRAGSSVVGQRIALTEQTVHVTISGRIAHTQIEQTFFNESPDELEGTYRFPLPGDASIAELSLLVGDKWMDAEMLERDEARRIFRTIVDATIPRDPALLEWAQGSTFKLKIFPIPAKGSRKIRIAYTQVLPLVGETMRYRYPLAGSSSGAQGEPIGTFELRVDVDRELVADAGQIATPMATLERSELDDRVRLSFAAKDFRPSHELGVDVPIPADDRRLHAETFRDRDGQGYFMLAFRPELELTPSARPTRYAFVLDRSHATTPELWAVARGLVPAIAAGFGSEDQMVVLACDTTCDVAPAGLAPASVALADADAFLREQTLAGASDLGGMLHAGARALNEPDARYDSVVVYLGDGQASAGRLAPDELLAGVFDQLPTTRVWAVALGARSDLLVLDALARRTGGDLIRADVSDDLRSLARTLQLRGRLPTATPLTLSLPPELTDVYPSSLERVRPGETITLVGKLAGPARGSLTLRVLDANGDTLVDELPIELDGLEPDTDERPRHAHLPRTWARFAIDELTASYGAAAKQPIIELSQRYNVLSRYTALIALESEAMYREFAVARTSAGTTGWDGSLPGALPELGPEFNGADARLGSDPDGAPSGSELSIGSAGSGFGTGQGSAGGFGHGSGGGRRGPVMIIRRASGPSEAELARLEPLREAVRADPTSRAAHRKLVARAFEIGADASADARAWVAADPDHAPALLAWADALAAKGDPLAARAYGSAVEAAPFDVTLQKRLAEGYELRGDLIRACAHRRAVVSLEPGRAEHHVDLAACLFANGDSLAARRVAERGLNQAAAREDLPQSVVLATLLGGEPTKLDRRSKAYSQLEQIVAGDPPPGLDSARTSVGGDLVAKATWTGDGELDVVLVDRRGRRRSAMQPVGIRVIRADHEQRVGAWMNADVRTWFAVEVTRVSGTGPLTGTLELRGDGETQRFAFELEQGSLRLAEIKFGEPKLEIAWKSVQASEGLDSDIVRRVLRTRLGQVRFCFNEGLKKNPNLAGRITSEFVISGEGLVIQTKLKKSTVKDDEVAKCIINFHRSWKFPTPRDGLNVRVTATVQLKNG